MGGRMAEVDLGLMLMKRHRLIGSTLRSRPVADKGDVMSACISMSGHCSVPGRLIR